MAAQKGKLFLLKLATDNSSPGDWTTIAGLRATSVRINGEDVDVTTKDDDGWQQRLAGAGVRSLEITADGVIQNVSAENTILSNSVNQSIDWYQLVNQAGIFVECQFQIRNYERAGPHDGAETFNISLASHGTPQFPNVT